MEGIPGTGSKVYSLIVGKSPVMRDFYKEITDEVSLKIASGRILDVGTGPGYLPIKIASKNRGLEVAGIDISSGMVKAANKNAEKIGLTQHIQFQIASAEKLPFSDGYFDLVVSTLSLHHWSKPAVCIKEIHRVLKQDGEAWIYDLRRDTTSETNSQIRRKYGWFVLFVILNIVRLHSSVTLKRIEEILSAVGQEFSKKSIEDRGIILKLKLIK